MPKVIQLSESQRRRQASIEAALGPLVQYLEDPSVVEIARNPDGSLWIDRLGCSSTKAEFSISDSDARRMLGLVAAHFDAQISASNPSLSAKLPGWGARLQAALPPIVEAPTFSLRLPPRQIFTLADYVKAQIMTAAQAHVLKAAAVHGHNILIAGSTGSGKTTLLNAFLHAMACSNERVVLLEDTPELQCPVANQVQVLVQPPLYTWQKAIADVKRQNPDRVILGEIRDASGLEAIKVWNSGHPGAASIHADSPSGALDQLCLLIEEGVVNAPRQLIARTIHYVAHIQRNPHSHSRRLTGIERVVGYHSGQWVTEPEVSSPSSESTLFDS